MVGRSEADEGGSLSPMIEEMRKGLTAEAADEGTAAGDPEVAFKEA